MLIYHLSALAGRLLIGVIGVVLIGCVHEHDTAQADAQLDEILFIGRPVESTIPAVTWYCEVHGSGALSTVSLSADQAPVADLLQELLYRANVPFRMGPMRLSGRCSLHLKNSPFMEACAAILRSCEAEANWDLQSSTPILNIQNRKLFTSNDPVAPSYQNTSKDQISKTIVVQHHSATTLANNLLGSTTSSGGLWKNHPGFSVAVSPEHNQIYLRGTPSDVERTAQICRQADQSAPKIKIEIAFFSRRPQGIVLGQHPTWTLANSDSFVQWNPGAFLQGGFTIAENQSHVPSQLDWTSTKQIFDGRLVSHTEMVVTSGEPTSLRVGKTGYLIVTSLSSGVPSGQQEVVDATTNFTLTPKALPSGMIQLDIDFSNARFSIAKNLQATILFRSQNTSITVPNGGFFLMGGNIWKYNQGNITAPLWLRKLPLISQVLTGFSEQDVDEYVVQYVRATLFNENAPLEIPFLPFPRMVVSDIADGLSSFTGENGQSTGY